MKEELSHFKQRTLLNWSALTIEILATALLYAIMVTFGVSKNLSVIIACVFAILLVSFGLIFIYKIYPKFKEKPVKVSLLEDYLTLIVDDLSVSKTSLLNALFLDMLESAFPIYRSKTTMSSWSRADVVISIKAPGSDPSRVIYVDLKGRHINITMDNPSKKQVLAIISMLTEEVKESHNVSVEQKKEQIEVIDRITKEAFRPRPNKALLKMLSEGLANIFKSSPDMDNAANKANSLTSLLS